MFSERFMNGLRRFRHLLVEHPSRRWRRRESRSHHVLDGKAALLVVLLICLTECIGLSPARSATLASSAAPVSNLQQAATLLVQEPANPPDDSYPAGLTQKQKQDLLKAKFEKMKKDADQLADLAKSLQRELDTSNQNVLSLKIVDKAEKIEKLARNIRNTARGD